MTKQNTSDSGPTAANSGHEDIARVLAEIAQRSEHIVNTHFAEQAKKFGDENTDDMGVGKAFTNLATQMMSDPFKLAEAGMKMWQSQIELWQTSMNKMAGNESQPAAKPAKGDNRFRHELWNNWLFDYIKDAYLVAAHDIQNTVAAVDGLDKQTARKVKFFTKQYIDALSPSNFVLTNPQVLKATIDSGGKNLLDGLNNMLQDVDRGKGQLAIKMTDTKAFTMGENVATTPGKVVFQTDLMQLIQYEPSTPDVYQTPLLIVPPWINKFYVLDLQPKNSFVKWIVDQGYTLFIISWVNPRKELSHKSFEDYMMDGPMAALDAMEQATGVSEANILGFCIGGILTIGMLSDLAAKGDKRIKAATFLATLVDFKDVGEISVFVDPEQLDTLEKHMGEKGYLEGHHMGEMFNMMRENDLIWSFVVNNYLMGRDPMPFDLLYWNSDSTRMPGKMHSFYLHNLYEKNLLCEPNGISLDGVGIDLTKVETPAYFISTKEDHIAPWKGTYVATQLYRGKTRFTLAGSGHIAGVVNPPENKKYGHWTNDETPADADDWFAGAAETAGSWWPEWRKWIKKYAGGSAAARSPGDGKLKVLEDAPGSYASTRFDKQD